MTAPVNPQNFSIVSVIWNHFSQVRNPSPGESRILHLVYGILEIVPFFGQLVAHYEVKYRIEQASKIIEKNALSKKISRLAHKSGLTASLKEARDSHLQEVIVETPGVTASATSIDIRPILQIFSTSLSDYSRKVPSRNSFPQISEADVSNIRAACLDASDYQFNNVIVPNVTKALIYIEEICKKVVGKIPSELRANRRLINNIETRSNQNIRLILDVLGGLSLGRKKIFIGSFLLKANAAMEEPNFDKAERLIAYAEQLGSIENEVATHITDQKEPKISTNQRDKGDLQFNTLQNRMKAFRKYQKDKAGLLSQIKKVAETATSAPESLYSDLVLFIIFYKKKTGQNLVDDLKTSQLTPTQLNLLREAFRNAEAAAKPEALSDRSYIGELGFLKICVLKLTPRQ